MKKSFLIGDKMTDIKATRKAGLKSILVTTGIYEQGDYRREDGYDETVVTVDCLAGVLEKIR